MADDNELLAWNKQGFIPAPSESLEAFSHRVHLSLASSPREPPRPHVAKAQEALAAQYDVFPNWVPILYSNHGLGIWHGGGTIIEEQEGVRLPLIQLRRSLKEKATFLGIYSVEEFVEHELAHVGRIAFDEPRFEEILAYRTSRLGFRRYFGPIIQSGKEVWLFLLTLIIAVGFDYFFFAMRWLEAGVWALLFYLVPVGLIGAGLYRLICNQRSVTRTLQALATVTEHPPAVLYRLSDTEISLFGRLSKEELRAYIAEQDSLRWQVIRTAYLQTMT